MSESWGDRVTVVISYTPENTEVPGSSASWPEWAVSRTVSAKHSRGT